MAEEYQAPVLALGDHMFDQVDTTTEVKDEENVSDITNNEETSEETKETSEEISTEENSTENTTEETTEDSTDDASEEEEPDENINGLYKYLKDTGFINTEDDFEFSGKPSELESLIQNSIESTRTQVQQDIMNKIPSDTGKTLFEYFMDGGEDLSGFINTFGPQEYSSLDPTDEDDAKKLVYLNMKQNSSLSDEDIQDIVTNMGDKVFDKAERIKTDFDAQHEEQQKAFIKQQKDAQKAALDYEKDFVSRLNTMKIPQEVKDGVLSSFNTLKVGDNDLTQYEYTLNQVQSNPEHFIQFLMYLNKYDPKKGFAYSNEKETTTKKTGTLRNYVKSSEGNSNQSKVKGKTPEKTAGGVPRLAL